MMKIAMGNDHSAIELKNIIREFVEEKGYEVIDFGTNSTESCDYPVYGEKVGRAVASGEADLRHRSRYFSGSQQGKGSARLRMQRTLQRQTFPYAQQQQRPGFRGESRRQ